MKQFGISAGQVSCLAELLNSKDPVSQKQLAESLVIDPAAAARTNEILIKKGLVERIVNPQNRRQKLVSVTMTAEKKYTEHFQVLNEIDEVFKNDLIAEEHEVAVKFLDKMIAGAMKKK